VIVSYLFFGIFQDTNANSILNEIFNAKFLQEPGYRGLILNNNFNIPFHNIKLELWMLIDGDSTFLYFWLFVFGVGSFFTDYLVLDLLGFVC